MSRAHNFSAGPAVLPLSVIEELASVLPEFQDTGMGLMELSHRSPAFDGGFIGESPEHRPSGIRTASPSPVVERDMDRCHSLSDEAVVGDCALVVAQRAASNAMQPPETHCERIKVEGWRAECWFLAAEEHRRKGGVVRGRRHSGRKL